MPSLTPTFIHIDTALQASRYRLMIWLSLGIALAVIIGLLPVPMSIHIGLWVLLLASLALSQLMSQQLLVISSLPVSKTPRKSTSDVLLPHLDWQIQCIQGYFVTPFGEQTDIYQAKLSQVKRFGMVMLIEFWVFEPFDKKMQFIVWQDQVDDDTWRQLNVIANQ